MARASRDRFSAGVPELKNFAKDLGLSETQWKHAEDAFFAILPQTLLLRAQAVAATQGRLPARAARDIKARGKGTLVYGGQGYSLGAEYGSYAYKQFNAWRGNREGAGYFLWPTVREFRDEEFTEQYAKDVLRVLFGAFSDRR